LVLAEVFGVSCFDSLKASRRLLPMREGEMLFILCTEVIIMMMGIGIVGPILPHYARLFGVSITMIGLLITVFGVARIVMDIPAGRMTEHLGRRPILISGPIVLGMGSLACGLAGSYWQLLIFRFVQGIGSAMYTTAAMVMLADISTQESRGRMMSFYQGSILLGAGLGPTLGGFVAELWGIRAPFFVFAVMAVVAALWAYARLPETRPPLASKAINGDEGELQKRPRLGPLLRDRDFLLVSFVTFGIFFTRTGTHNQLIPLLGADRLGLSISKIGVALTLIAVTQIVALLLAGAMAGRLERKKLITPGCLLLGLGLAVAAKSFGYSLFLVSCIVMGFGIGLAGPILSAYVADILPKEEYGIGMGLYRAVSDIGFVTGPVLLGRLADLRGFTFPILFNAALISLAALTFFFWAKEPTLRRRDEHCDEEQEALVQVSETSHERY